MDGSTRRGWCRWCVRLEYHALVQRLALRYLLWFVRWHALTSRLQFQRMRMRMYLFLWTSSVQALWHNGLESSATAWAIVLCPPLLLLWPVLWLLLHR